jgi:hypothetical protein
VVPVDGDAVTDAPVVPLSPVEGLHVYVDAPEAESTVFVPEQIVLLPAETVIVGRARTVSEIVPVDVQLFDAVPVTV